jgi:hypothetical protein
MADFCKAEEPTCTTCAHFFGWRGVGGCYRVLRCHRLGYSADVVTGRRVAAQPLRCVDERSQPGLIFNRGRCGPKGRFWQPKGDA